MSVGGRLFVTFEGIDGAGKSSHLDAAEALCVAAGRVVVRSREPGGTPLAEGLREAILHQPMDGITETLLVFAARRDHVVRVIAPALARGDVVLCDRFSDASFAYQGAGRGQSLALLERLEAAVQEGLQPDLTLWFDLEPRLAAERRAAARTADRFEAEHVAFFEKVRAGYRARMAGAPERFVRIDSARPRAQVAADVAAALHARLAARPAGARAG